MSINEQATVLVAEDSEEVRDAIRLMLEEAGFTVAGMAPDGMEAVALTQSLRPDVVLMDVNMPDMDGIEAARLIYEACPTPVVVLTAYDTAEILKEASSAGVGMYLTKPTTPHDLRRAIGIAIARFEDTMELRRLNDELQARNEELNAFAHTVAHDLKNPLQFIINYANILREEWGATPAEEAKGHLLSIEKHGLRMNNIINELLLLAETRHSEVALAPLDMGSIVDEAQKRLDYLIEEQQAEVHIADSWPEVIGYGPWVEEVWVNYLSNALKYGGQPPIVEIGANPQSDGMVCFWMRDNGPGIAPEDQERLFRPFTRLDQVKTTGHGLGLSIVRGIVEKLGGEVGIKSKPGQGSTFTFTLPAA